MATNSPHGPGTNQYGTKPKQADPATLLSETASNEPAAANAAADPLAGGDADAGGGKPAGQPSGASVMRRDARRDASKAAGKLAGRSGLTFEQKLACIDAADERLASAATQVHAAAETYGGFADDAPTHPLLADGDDDPHGALPLEPEAGLTAKELRRRARSHTANAAVLLDGDSGLDDHGKRARLTGAHQHLTAAQQHLAAARAQLTQ